MNKQDILKILNDESVTVTDEESSFRVIQESDFDSLAERLADDWVKVEERLPERGEQVLTFTPESDISEVEYRLIRYGYQISGFPHAVTHWRKLPNNPEKE